MAQYDLPHFLKTDGTLFRRKPRIPIKQIKTKKAKKERKTFIYTSTSVEIYFLFILPIKLRIPGTSIGVRIGFDRHFCLYRRKSGDDHFWCKIFIIKRKKICFCFSQSMFLFVFSTRESKTTIFVFP